jgi:hypothetical protein
MKFVAGLHERGACAPPGRMTTTRKTCTPLIAIGYAGFKPSCMGAGVSLPPPPLPPHPHAHAHAAIAVTRRETIAKTMNFFI